MAADPPRRLPVTPRLIGAEAIGSFLNRLAKDNGLRTKTLIRQLAPALNLRQITPVTDTAAYWRPADLERLAALSGKPLDRLQRAIPAIADALAADDSTNTGSVIRACDRCTAAKGIAVAVYQRARPHDHLCRRHLRWLRIANGTDLARMPEILNAQRRLDHLARRHPDAEIANALINARTVISAWLIRPWHPALQQRWDKRLTTLLGPAPHSPGTTRTATLPAATHPELVIIAEALLSCSASTGLEHDLSNLANALGLPDGRVPGERDPLRRIVMQYAHGTHPG